jgi:AraC family transcriptional regulator
LAELRHGGWTGEDVVLDSYVVSLTLNSPVSLNWRVGGRTQPKTLLPGHISFIPAGVPFSISHEDSAWYLNVWLTPQFMAQALGSSGLGAIEHLAPRCCFRDDLIANIIEELRTEASSAEGGDATRVSSLGNQLAIGLARACAASDPLDRFDPRPLSLVKLRRVIEFIEQRLTEPVSLGDMAAVAGLSAWHFARAFKLATGSSPHSFLLRRRLVKADTLLRLPGIAVAEVAVKSGFCDQSHLSMHFRRATGMTPARWRNSFLAPQTTEISTTA